ncbi:MAG: hypothetical protein JOZ02_15005 [Acidobacteria bacterium]|nr:hypothetical protein [Acidobacteriota bacterium]
MSDYLWDKKGEPDADVARLESLLGTFAHEPRPLEWPAGAAAPEPRPAKLLPFASRLRTSRRFAPAALAAAAALLVASVLVASAFLRARVADEGGRATARESSRPDAGARKDERPAAPPQVERTMLEPPPFEDLKGGKKVESAAVGNLPKVERQRKGLQLAAAPRRRQRDLNAEPLQNGGAGSGGGLTLEAMSTRAGASSLVDNARLLTKEQLVYALRLTGAKLRDIREKAQKAEARP